MTPMDLVVIAAATAAIHRMFLVDSIGSRVRAFLSRHPRLHGAMCVPCSAFWIAVAVYAAYHSPVGREIAQVLCVWLGAIFLWTQVTIRMATSGGPSCPTCKGKK